LNLKLDRPEYANGHQISAARLSHLRTAKAYFPLHHCFFADGRYLDWSAVANQDW
jgi:hypothetical protein